MYFKQKDVFWGMDKDFVAQIMKLTVPESYDPGDIIFRIGDPAEKFFILTKGQIKLSLGDAGHVVYIVSKAGEAFGWSSLIGRDAYSATAECLSTTNLLKINGEQLQTILEKDSDNGLIFFKRLAGILGNRLLQSYQKISSAMQPETALSFGTGQVIASESAEA